MQNSATPPKKPFSLTIPLDSAKLAELRTAFTTPEHAIEAITKLYFEIIEEATKRREAAWDSVLRSLCVEEQDYSDFVAWQKENEIDLQVNYSTGIVFYADTQDALDLVPDKLAEFQGKARKEV